MVEVLGAADGLPEALAVLDVAGVVADAGVEDVVEGVLAEEEVADDTEAAAVGLGSPQSAQVSDGVDGLLLVAHGVLEAVVGQIVRQQQRPHLLLVPLDERYDALPEVLGDVLRLIFQSSRHPALRRALRLLASQQLLMRIGDREVEQVMRVFGEGMVRLLVAVLLRLVRKGRGIVGFCGGGVEAVGMAVKFGVKQFNARMGGEGRLELGVIDHWRVACGCIGIGKYAKVSANL